jgi:hypothetical protein
MRADTSCRFYCHAADVRLILQLMMMMMMMMMMMTIIIYYTTSGDWVHRISTQGQ